MTDGLPDPMPSVEAEPFYAAASERRFLLKRCQECARTHWYPRAACPFCAGDTDWEEASGRGEVYSFTHLANSVPPHILAYVTLAEGPNMLTRIVDCAPDAVRIGQSVKVTFKTSSNGTMIPCFTPADN